MLPRLIYKGVSIFCRAEPLLPAEGGDGEGPRQFHSTLRLAIPHGEVGTLTEKDLEVPRREPAASSPIEAVEHALQYARDVIDGKVEGVDMGL